MKYVIDKATGDVVEKPEKPRIEPIEMLPPIAPELGYLQDLMDAMRLVTTPRVEISPGVYCWTVYPPR